ncbi:gp258 [Sphingomonas phage PAU]|uniref:gp258 n=1 Tax=Sphingomonas phage PAU TaxID=1150991 RepID=UPI0002573408|nr:gp258 [Sphingomonas phage PAU]AFF28256.1 gp258 [Sphingomonas phage PAU]
MKSFIVKHLVFDWKFKTNVFFIFANIFIFAVPHAYITSLRVGNIFACSVALLYLIAMILKKREKAVIVSSVPRPYLIIFGGLSIVAAISIALDLPTIPSFIAAFLVSWVIYLLPLIYQKIFGRFTWNDLDDSQKWQLGLAEGGGYITPGKEIMTEENWKEWRDLDHKFKLELFG